MNRIESVFSQPGHKALIAYLTVGYPGIEATREIVPLLVESGCDMVELGIPFSDPLADGTTIQRSSYHALQRGITPKSCLEVARGLRGRVNAPLIFMTYYNPVLKYGLSSFCADCVKSGIEGIIIPDMPPEEGGELEGLAERNRLSLIYLLAPTSSDARIGLVTARSHGFIYLVSLSGVTGAREALPPELEGFIRRVRAKTSLPLCVGFGVSNPEQARRVAKVADGVIIGSRIIEIIENSQPSALVSFMHQIRVAIDEG